MLKEGKSYYLQTDNLFFVLRETRVVVKEQLLKDDRKKCQKAVSFLLTVGLTKIP